MTNNEGQGVIRKRYFGSSKGEKAWGQKRRRGQQDRRARVTASERKRKGGRSDRIDGLVPYGMVSVYLTTIPISNAEGSPS
jgi:hypothetical protein